MQKAINISTEIPQENFDEKLAGLISFLKNRHTERASEMSDSLALLQAGAKDSIAKEVEQMLIDPLAGFYQNWQKNAQSLAYACNIIITKFFELFNDNICHLGIVDSSHNAKTVCIVLKEDNFDSRLFINSKFKELYSEFEFCDTFPIFIQVVPKDVFPRLEISKIIF